MKIMKFGKGGILSKIKEGLSRGKRNTPAADICIRPIISLSTYTRLPMMGLAHEPISTMRKADSKCGGSLTCASLYLNAILRV